MDNVCSLDYWLASASIWLKQGVTCRWHAANATLARIESLELTKIAENFLICPSECDRQNARPVAFNVSLPLSERFLRAIYPVDAGDKSKGCRERYIRCAKLLNVIKEQNKTKMKKHLSLNMLTSALRLKLLLILKIKIWSLNWSLWGTWLDNPPISVEEIQLIYAKCTRAAKTCNKEPLQ